MALQLAFHCAEAGFQVRLAATGCGGLSERGGGLGQEESNSGQEGETCMCAKGDR